MAETSETDRQRDADRLRSLEEKLAQAKRAAEPAKPVKDFHQANQAWRMVTELVAGLGIGLLIGYGLDRWLGTMPVFLVIFVLLGFVAGVKTMLRTAAEIGKTAEGKAQAAARRGCE
ncbi:MAG: AtpZ/AtpI family protein [Paracoccus sp. (in: a-proteobacteria)]|uniref:AtpZ/AtpI family protein n=1 Tax=Paracoccus sp. TaxID=267 RepID=UPI0026DFEC93|nr:AtpZ/AtpI family protein [Paracoccus sp. (in: a-proteobacteria)]MDO5621535.1 AtpZ/AtpI family protein [Paracoccus sp. (in: a-proteobacteria)]